MAANVAAASLLYIYGRTQRWWGRILPGDLTYLDTDYTVVSTTNSLNFPESGWWGRILSAMKVLIPIIIGLLVVGCGQSDTERLEAEKQHKEIQSRLANKIELEYEKLKVELEAENRKLKVRNNVAAKPVKLTAEEKKVIGEYELKEDRVTFNEVFLENGIVESYVDGKKQSEQKWTIINGQIHTINEDGYIFVWRINKVKSLP